MHLLVLLLVVNSYCAWSSSNFLYNLIVKNLYGYESIESYQEWISQGGYCSFRPPSLNMNNGDPELVYALRGFNWCIRGSWNSGEIFNLCRAKEQWRLTKSIADFRGWNDSWGLYKLINALHWALIQITTKQNIQESTIKSKIKQSLLSQNVHF